MAERHNLGKLGIVFALDEETKGLRRVLGQSRATAIKGRCADTWHMSGMNIAVSVSGVGREKSEAAVEAMISAGADWIISAGFAAGVDERADVGDIIIARRVLLADVPNAEPISCSEFIARAAPPASSMGYAIYHGDLATTDSIITSASDKEAIHRATGAIALDMESYAAAAVCQKRGVPFAAIRSISDTSKQNLPYGIEKLAGMNAITDRAIFVASRPSLWDPLLNLRRQAQAASHNLGDVLGIVLLRLM